MKHKVEHVGDPYFRGVTCCYCGQKFRVCLHNIERVLLSHGCVRNPDPKLVVSNGYSPAPDLLAHPPAVAR
jgi:hypothetical protein